MHHRFGGIIFILLSLPAFLYFGRSILTTSSVDRTIKHNREIETAFRQAANFIEDYQLANKQLPSEAEFYHRPKIDRHPLGTSITLNGCLEPLPENFGEKPKNSYYLGYWQGEWCEFLTGWEQKTTLKFERNDYFPFLSFKFTGLCFALSIIVLSGGLYLTFKNRDSRS